jgi:hypothetical protein
LSDGGKREWFKRSTSHAGYQVFGQRFSFAQGMLGGRRMKLAGFDVRHERTIA